MPFLHQNRKCLISNAICASPVEHGKEILCDTYKFDFKKWFEQEILKLAEDTIASSKPNNITCHVIAFKVMIKLMGTEIDHKIDYTYEDLYNIIKKNWKNIEEKLNKQPKHHSINPNQSQQQNPPHISHPFQKTQHTPTKQTRQKIQHKEEN